MSVWKTVVRMGTTELRWGWRLFSGSGNWARQHFRHSFYEYQTTRSNDYFDAGSRSMGFVWVWVGKGVCYPAEGRDSYLKVGFSCVRWGHCEGLRRQCVLNF